MFFGDTPPARMLLGTTADHITKVLQMQISSDHDRIDKTLLEFGKVHPEDASCIQSSFEGYVHGLFSVYSRAADIEFSVDSYPAGRQRVLVPQLDMLNHSPDANAEYRFNKEARSVDIVAIKSIGEGEEILLNYGPLPNLKLLVFYGFAVEGNPHSTAWINVSLDPEQPGNQERIEIMKSKYPDFVPNDAIHIPSDGSIPPALLDLLSLLSSGSLLPPSPQSLQPLLQSLNQMSRTISANLLLLPSDGGGMERYARIYAEGELEILAKALSNLRTIMDLD